MNLLHYLLLFVLTGLSKTNASYGNKKQLSRHHNNVLDYGRGRMYNKRMIANYFPEMTNAEANGNNNGDCNGNNNNNNGENEMSCGTASKCAGGSIAITKSNSKQKATNIAQKAAQEAKAANDAQVGAAEAAAQQVKMELAEKAIQSARAAEAALAGKQQIVEQLQQEKCEAEAVVVEVSASLVNTQNNANAASQSVLEAQSQLNLMKNLVKAAQTNLQNIENVANGAQQELAEKTQLLDAAKSRVDGLQRQLAAAKQDFERTKQAAYKAACAAVEAKQKAARNRRMSLPRRHRRNQLLEHKSSAGSAANTQQNVRTSDVASAAAAA